MKRDSFGKGKEIGNIEDEDFSSNKGKIICLTMVVTYSVQYNAPLRVFEMKSGQFY